MKENLDSQAIYRRRSVDEIVRFEKNGQGTVFAFQDANWNVTSTMNYAAVPLDRIYTTPYGQPTFDAETIRWGKVDQLWWQRRAACPVSLGQASRVARKVVPDRRCRVL